VNLEENIGETNNRLDEQPARADELLKLHRDWRRVVGDK
jgi:hypothetical protein